MFFSKSNSMYFILLLFLVSCQDVKKPERPDNLISEDKMVLIYMDAYINNAAKNVNNKLLLETGVKLDSVLYAVHQVDSLQFAKSNAFYSSDLSNYVKIYSRVEIRLQKLQEKTKRALTEIEIKEEEALCDSLYPKDSLKITPVKIDTSLVTPVQSY